MLRQCGVCACVFVCLCACVFVCFCVCMLDVYRSVTNKRGMSCAVCDVIGGLFDARRKMLLSVSMM